MNKISISLSVDEWNIVMQSLGNMPFAQVVNVISAIKEQAQPQIKSVDDQAEAE